MRRIILGNMTASICSLFDRASGDAADHLLREDQVEDQDRDHRQGQRGKHCVPVADELAEELLHTQGDGGGLAAGRQDQREPQVVPDRDHGEDADRTQGRTHQRHDHPIDPVFAGAVQAGGLFEVARHLAHELVSG